LMRIVVGFVYYFDFDGARSQLISLTNDGVASILSFDTRSLTSIGTLQGSPAGEEGIAMKTPF